MADKKLGSQEDAVVDVIVVAEPVQNDSTHGLERLYAGLEPFAKRLRSACSMLFVFSVFLMGSLEGILGLCAACGVLCCAAPGSLGTAYAARCTRVLAVMCSGVALFQLITMSVVGFLVPDMSPMIDELCSSEPLPEHDLTAVPLRQHAAHHIVAFAASGARHLQAVAPDVKCERAASFVQNVLPCAVLIGATLEFGLFMAALITAKASRQIMFEAHRQGANAM
jgi:hypothetical protein